MLFNEEKIVKIIEPQILRCRPGDWEHAKRVVKFIKILGQEKTILPQLIIAGYIHDIGWRDLLNKEKITFEELLAQESQANKNSEPFIRELLKALDILGDDTEIIIKLVSSADKHKSTNEDEEIIVDADQLSKLDINHLKEKYQKSEWVKLYELWEKEIGNRIKTKKAKKLYPELLVSLKKSIKKCPILL